MKREEKVKIYRRIFKFCFTILLICFLTLYFSQAAGYYEYDQYKRSTFTSEQIKKFEADVAAGKKVDINEYVSTDNQDYSNKMSDLGYQISDKIGKYVKMGIEGTFGALNKLVAE